MMCLICWLSVEIKSEKSEWFRRFWYKFIMQKGNNNIKIRESFILVQTTSVLYDHKYQDSLVSNVVKS